MPASRRIIPRPDLLLQFAERELAQRYKGSLGGVTWLVLQPVLLLALYTFVFVEIFRVRWPGAAGGAEGSSLDFALMVFAGMSLHGLLADCTSRAVLSISGNPNFVKKQRFPLTTLPYSLVLANLAQYCVALLLLIVASVLVFGLPPRVAVLIPIYLVPFALICIAFTLALSALGVYLRDIGNVVGMLMTALFFLSPILYPVEFVPEAYRPLIQLNPLTFPIEALRDLLFRGVLPSHSEAVFYGVVSVLLFFASLAFFRRLQRGFADVL